MDAVAPEAPGPTSRHRPKGATTPLLGVSMGPAPGREGLGPPSRRSASPRSPPAPPRPGHRRVKDCASLTVPSALGVRRRVEGPDSRADPTPVGTGQLPDVSRRAPLASGQRRGPETAPPTPPRASRTRGRNDRSPWKGLLPWPRASPHTPHAEALSRDRPIHC